MNVNYNSFISAADLHLYGETYSGLEYDYRGLIHVYDKLGDSNGLSEFTVMLTQWKEIRERLALKQKCPLSLDESPRPLAYIKELITPPLNSAESLNPAKNSSTSSATSQRHSY